MKVAYMDLDGVLVNWDLGVQKLFPEVEFGGAPTQWNGLQEKIAEEYGINVPEAERFMWARIEGTGTEFWEGLELYGMGLALYERMWRMSPVIFLTSPSASPSSASGKMAWLQRHSSTLEMARASRVHQLGDSKYASKPAHRTFAICPDKALLAGPDKLLVDDRQKNVERFAAAGGAAILWPQPWNTPGLSEDVVVSTQVKVIEQACWWLK